jgi:hypothetical protein
MATLKHSRRWTGGLCAALIALGATTWGCGGSSSGTQQDSGPTQTDSSVPQVDGGGDGPAGTDGPVGDGPAGDGGAGIAGHRGTAVMSGAVQAQSTRYRVIMSTGQSPGGNTTAASGQHKLRGGLVGATQGR